MNRKWDLLAEYKANIIADRRGERNINEESHFDVRIKDNGNQNNKIKIYRISIY